VPVELRPIVEDELDRFMRTGMAAFGESLSDEAREFERRYFEFDRSLVALDGGDMVATAGAYSFDLTLPGLTSVPAAGVTWVAVLPTHRRRGILTQMLARQFDDFADCGEPVAVLTASEAAIYGRFGYGIATMNNVVEIRKAGLEMAVPSRAGGRLRMVEPDDARKVLPAVYEEYRRARPGALTRNERWWESYFTDPEKFRDGSSIRYYVIHENEEGEADGYVTYRVSWDDWAPERPGSTVQVEAIHSADPEVDAALFGFLLELDLVWQLKSRNRPVPDPVRWRLNDFRRYRILRTVDHLWVRLIDIPAALSARRYAAEGVLTIAVDDRFRPASTGTYRLEGGPDGATCAPVDGAGEAEVRLSVDSLGAAFLGGVTLATLDEAGRCAGDREAIRRADVMFASTPTSPYCDREF
jgi:predicted acetyltransferase